MSNEKGERLEFDIEPPFTALVKWSGNGKQALIKVDSQGRHMFGAALIEGRCPPIELELIKPDCRRFAVACSAGALEAMK